jgi:hypothetical protein
MPEKITGTLEIIDGQVIVKTSKEDVAFAVTETGNARFGFAKQGITVAPSGGSIIMDGPSGPAIRFSARPVFTPPGTIPAASLELGGGGGSGRFVVQNSAGKDAIVLGAESRAVSILNDAGVAVIVLDGRAGDVKLKGDVEITDDSGVVVIHLDRKARDIKLKGADCAEVFAANDATVLEPGSLCVIGPSGALEACCKPYDTRVAGVVAGAGDLHPGIVLGQDSVPERSVALSITGRVWCKVDAGFGPIVPGDLITTSPTPGHGMLANDRSRLTGAIAGKALAGVSAGCELIPIIVGLQ